MTQKRDNHVDFVRVYCKEPDKVYDLYTAVKEVLYLAPNGRWILMGEGGPKTSYRVVRGGVHSPGMATRELTDEEALTWLVAAGMPAALANHLIDFEVAPLKDVMHVSIIRTDDSPDPADEQRRTSLYGERSDNPGEQIVHHVTRLPVDQTQQASTATT